MRSVIVLAAGCTAAAAPAPIEAVALDRHGPIPGVDVELFALPARACPCPDAELVDSHGVGFTPGNVPCTCPAALAMWRDQLAHCAVGAPLARTRSDAHGHAMLPAVAGAALLHAATDAGEQWITVPPTHATLALELDERIVPQVVITGSEPPVRAAIAYADGHCVPLHRAGKMWTSDRGVARRLDGVVIAEGKTGFAAGNWMPTLGPDAELVLVPARSIAGSCSRPQLAVHLENAYQRLVMHAGSTGAFRFADVLGFPARVACRDAKGALVDELAYDPDHGFDDNSYAMTSFHDSCMPIAIVDAHGAPLAGAQITVAEGDISGHVDTADANGRACVSGAKLTIDAPLALGGQCAGQRELVLQPFQPDETAAPRRTALPIQLLPRTTWHGRIVTPEQLPIANATVYISHSSPTGTPGCSDLVETAAGSAADGALVLPMLPAGKLELSIDHPWYAARTIEIDNRGPPVDIVLDRGATWAARVLDPDGNPLARCEIFVTEPAGRNNKRVHCGPHGELALDALEPGDTRLRVVVEHHALGEYRSYTFTTQIKANERRSDDIRWPAGVAIAGRAVDVKGQPFANIIVRAIPKGEVRPPSQFGEHELTVRTDASGHFELRHLQPGVWLIEGPRGSIEATTGRRDVELVLTR